MSKNDRWFAVRLLFESQHPEEPDVESLFEDRIVLVRAESEEKARLKAEEYGRSEDSEYKNMYEKTVVVTFTEVLDLKDVDADKIVDLTEIYHHFLTPDELQHVRRALQPLPDSIEAASL
jgi:Domain of unknown function (DUF4288)